MAAYCPLRPHSYVLSVSVSQVYNDVDYDAGRFLGGGGQVGVTPSITCGFVYVCCKVARQGKSNMNYYLSGIGVFGFQGEHALLRTRGAGFRHHGKIQFGIMINEKSSSSTMRMLCTVNE